MLSSAGLEKRFNASVSRNLSSMSLTAISLSIMVNPNISDLAHFATSQSYMFQTSQAQTP